MIHKAKFILLALIFSLAGCASYDLYKAAIAEESAKAADSALEAAVWHICKASPVGAIKRRFKTDREIAAYNVICPDGILQSI